MTVYSQNWIYDVMLSVDSWGSLHESKNTSQSVTSKLLPAPFCLYLNGFLHRFFVFHLLPISRMRCTLPSMCHLHCHNNVVEWWNRWRTVADWGGVRRGRANLKSSSTVRSADGERAALKHWNSPGNSLLIVKSRHIDQPVQTRGVVRMAWMIQRDSQSLVINCSMTLHCLDKHFATLALTSTNHVYVPNKMWFVLSTKMHSPPGLLIYVLFCLNLF